MNFVDRVICNALYLIDVHPRLAALAMLMFFAGSIIGLVALAIVMFPYQQHPCQDCEGSGQGDKLSCRPGCEAYRLWDLETREWL